MTGAGGTSGAHWDSDADADADADAGADATGPDGLPPRQRTWAVLALSLEVSVTVLVGSLINVALPGMAREFGSSASAIVWVVNAYQLTVTVMLLPLAALAERRGFKGVFLAGAALFAAASLAAALVHSLPALLLLRGLQGVGAAGIMGANTALLRACFPAAQLGRGMGINGMVVAASAAAGPTVGGLLLSVGSWSWLFVLQATVAAVGLPLAWRCVPRLAASGGGFDHLGALLQGALLVLLLTAVEQSHRGSALIASTLLAAATAVGVVFVRRELGHPRPMLPLDLLRRPAIVLSLLSALFSFCAQMAAQVALPFHLHQLLGWQAQRIGLLMTPMPLAMMVVAPLAGALSDRVPAGLLGGVGLVLGAVALALLATLPADATAADVVWRMALAGSGFALFSAPNVRSVVAAVPPARSGAAGSLIAIARLLGQTSGASLVAWLLGMAVLQSAPAAASSSSAAPQSALALAAAFALAAAACSLLRLRQRAASG